MDYEEAVSILGETTPTTKVMWWEGHAKLNPNKILVPDYQMQTLNRKQIDKIVTMGWREELTAQLLVNHREGDDYVYVGRHRLLAIRELIRLGRLPRTFLVECTVRRLSLQQEMDAFREAVERTRSGREGFVDAILTKAPTETAVTEMADHFGFFHVRDERSREVSAQYRFECEQELLSIYRGERLQNTSYKGLLSPTDGPAVLAVVLYLHKRCWLPRASQTRGNILRHATAGALAEIVHRYGSSHMISGWRFAGSQAGAIDMDALEVVLQQYTPDEWVELTKKSPIIGGEKVYELMAKLMLFGKEYRKTVDMRLWYNRKRRGSDRLDLFN